MPIGAEPLVVWINGAYGVGKAAVADELVRLLPDSVSFGPQSSDEQWGLARVNASHATPRRLAEWIRAPVDGAEGSA